MEFLRKKCVRKSSFPNVFCFLLRSPVLPQPFGHVYLSELPLQHFRSRKDKKEVSMVRGTPTMTYFKGFTIPSSDCSRNGDLFHYYFESQLYILQHENLDKFNRFCRCFDHDGKWPNTFNLPRYRGCISTSNCERYGRSSRRGSTPSSRLVQYFVKTLLHHVHARL